MLSFSVEGSEHLRIHCWRAAVETVFKKVIKTVPAVCLFLVIAWVEEATVKDTKECLKTSF